MSSGHLPEQRVTDMLCHATALIEAATRALRADCEAQATDILKQTDEQNAAVYRQIETLNEQLSAADAQIIAEIQRQAAVREQTLSSLRARVQCSNQETREEEPSVGAQIEAKTETVDEVKRLVTAFFDHGQFPPKQCIRWPASVDEPVHADDEQVRQVFGNEAIVRNILNHSATPIDILNWRLINATFDEEIIRKTRQEYEKMNVVLTSAADSDRVELSINESRSRPTARITSICRFLGHTARVRVTEFRLTHITETNGNSPMLNSFRSLGMNVGGDRIADNIHGAILGLLAHNRQNVRVFVGLQDFCTCLRATDPCSYYNTHCREVGPFGYMPNLIFQRPRPLHYDKLGVTLEMIHSTGSMNGFPAMFGAARPRPPPHPQPQQLQEVPNHIKCDCLLIIWGRNADVPRETLERVIRTWQVKEVEIEFDSLEEMSALRRIAHHLPPHLQPNRANTVTAVIENAANIVPSTFRVEKLHLNFANTNILNNPSDVSRRELLHLIAKMRRLFPTDRITVSMPRRHDWSLADRLFLMMPDQSWDDNRQLQLEIALFPVARTDENFKARVERWFTERGVAVACVWEELARVGGSPSTDRQTPPSHISFPFREFRADRYNVSRLTVNIGLWSQTLNFNICYAKN